MDYQQAVAFIHSLLKFGIKPGLERMNALLDELGHPEQSLRFVHVAGTNGKGSTCTMLSNILIDSGYKTGLFTSPYVVDFCERMQINGQMISHTDLAAEVTAMRPVLLKLKEQGIQPTEFEVITAMAFHYFFEKKCDIVVLEVGLGGRLDSTNVIGCPLVSVITSVSFDHMGVLGDTLPAIALEKCGIIKQGGRTVSYPCQHPQVQTVLKDTCAARGNPLILPGLTLLHNRSETLEGLSFYYNGEAYTLPLTGRHQLYNAMTVIETAKTLAAAGLTVSGQTIRSGIARTVLPARMELLQADPVILLDGGHNEDCAKALDAVLHTYLPGKKLVALMGMMEDKAYDQYLSCVAPHFTEIICVSPCNPRALSADALAMAAGRYCGAVCSCPDITAAAQAAMEALKSADALVVCGSFYLAAEIRPILI